ncbi:restriction endonuclease subunit S [Vibrio vulnificus]|nr:restriction endonuclease subunit S [Vibrio vulnificus]
MSWPMVKLGEHISVLSGFAFKSSLFGTEGMPLVRIRDVVPGYTNTYYSGEYSPEYIVQQGDLLVGLDGDFNRALWKSGAALLNQRVCKLIANETTLDGRYLYHLLPRELDFIHQNTPAVTVKHLSVKKIKDIEIPLPPLDEQKRIAAILDKADAIRQKRKQAIALADEFLRSVFLEMFGDPVTNPKGWEKRELGQLLSSIDSGKSPKCESREAADREWGVLKLSAVTYGEYRSGENKAFLGDPTLIEKYEVKKGDLLFTRKNTHKLVAAVSYVFETEEKRVLPDLIFRLNVSDEESLNKLYLFSLLAYPSQRKEIQALAGGAAGSMPNISKANLSLVQIPIPPIELQRNFAEVVNAYRKVFSKLTMHTEIEGLFEALSQNAFSGQL